MISTCQTPFEFNGEIKNGRVIWSWSNTVYLFMLCWACGFMCTSFLRKTTCQWKKIWLQKTITNFWGCALMIRWGRDQSLLGLNRFHAFLEISTESLMRIRLSELSYDYSTLIPTHLATKDEPQHQAQLLAPSQGEAEKVKQGRCSDEHKRDGRCGGEMTGQFLGRGRYRDLQENGEKAKWMDQTESESGLEEDLSMARD